MSELRRLLTARVIDAIYWTGLKRSRVLEESGRENCLPWRPDCIEGYAEALFAFAEFLKREGTTVPPPRAVISGASTLMHDMREKIQNALGARVVDVVDGMAMGGVVGCEGVVLVTTLANLTMPLIG